MANVYGDKVAEVRTWTRGALGVSYILTAPPRPTDVYRVLDAMHRARPSEAFVQLEVIYPLSDGTADHYEYVWNTTEATLAGPGGREVHGPHSLLIWRGRLSRPAFGQTSVMGTAALVPEATARYIADVAAANVAVPKEETPRFGLDVPPPAAGPFGMGVAVSSAPVEAMVTTASATGRISAKAGPPRPGFRYLQVHMRLRVSDMKTDVPAPPPSSLVQSATVYADGVACPLLGRQGTLEDRRLEFEVPADARKLRLEVQLPEELVAYAIR